MATFTITTTVNIDTLSVKAGGDTYNINGGTLNIDQDSRYGLNANTSAILGNVTPSASLGGNVYIDATLVRLIPYDTGSGNVPADGTTISKGGASGKLIGVYDTLTSAPTAAGSPMPADGYIKIKQWNSVAFSAGALTGLTANATGADVVGWIEVVGQDATTMTLSRLNNTGATPLVQGAYYQIGTTGGTPARGDTYQIPTNGDTNQYHAGVQVETSSGSGVYEWWPVTPSSALVASVGTETTDSMRGKFCWISTSGVLRFGHDGTNSTGGGLPGANCKIRIPNVFLAGATSAAKTVNALSTVNSRFGFVTAAAGNLVLDKCSATWRCNNINTPRAVTMTNCAIYTAITVTTNASACTFTNICVSSNPAVTTNTFVFSSSTEGFTLDSSVICGGTFGAANQSIVNLTNTNNPTITNSRIVCTGDKSVTSNYAVNTNGVKNLTLNNNIYGVGVFLLNTVNGGDITNSVCYGAGGGKTEISTSTNLFGTSNKCTDITIDTLNFGGLAGNMQKNFLINILAGTIDGLTVRNIGTFASPIDCGGAGQIDSTTSRTTTTCTVTHTGHGLVTNNVIVVYVCDSTAAVPLGAKVITVVDANTFTFTCTNAGSATPKISYFTSFATTLFNIAAANFNIKIQNVHFSHINGAAFLTNNADKVLTIQNFTVDTYNPTPSTKNTTNITANSISETPAPPIAQSSVYGTIFVDSFIRPTTVSNPTGASWSRSGTTVTVTNASHSLQTNDRIQVANSSATTPLPNGLYTVTVTDSGTFTIVGVNSGGTTGTLDYRVEDSRLTILMNESSAETTSYYTIDAGSPGFTGSGTLSAPNVSDQVTWVMPDYIVGYDSFLQILPSFTGLTNTQAQAFDWYYDIDTGSGYSGTFKNLSYNRSGGGGSSSSTNVTMTDTTGVNAGDYVYGIGIADGAKVVSITNSTTIVVSIANAAAVSGVLTFNQLPNATFTSSGFKLKVRVKTNATNTTPITAVLIPIKSTSTSRAVLYPQTTDVPLTITVLDASTLSPVQNARVYVAADSGGVEVAGTVLLQGTTDVNGQLTGTYGYVSDQPIIGWARKASASTYYREAPIGGTITSDGFSSSAFLVEDE